jgi:nucleoside-diphosphate-sugar epimerase
MEIIDNGQAVPSFLYSAINNDAIYMHSEGKAVRDFTYVTEAIEAIFRILFMGAAGEAYNVGAGFCSSIAALAETVASISGKTVKIDALKQSPKYLRSTIIEATPDATQLRKLGWNPEVDIPTGIKMTLESYK